MSRQSGFPTWRSLKYRIIRLDVLQRRLLANYNSTVERRKGAGVLRWCGGILKRWHKHSTSHLITFAFSSTSVSSETSTSSGLGKPNADRIMVAEDDEIAWEKTCMMAMSKWLALRVHWVHWGCQGMFWIWAPSQDTSQKGGMVLEMVFNKTSAFVAFPQHLSKNHRGGNSITEMPSLKWNSMSGHNPAKQLKSKGSDMCSPFAMTGFCLLLLHKQMCSSPCVWDFLFSQTHSRLHKIARSKSRLHTYALASSLAPVGCAMWGPSPSHHTRLSEVQASVVLTEKDPPNLRSIGITLFFTNEDQLEGRELGCQNSSRDAWGADLDPPTVASADLCSASATPGCRIAARLLYLHLTENVSHVASRRFLGITASLLSCLTSATLWDFMHCFAVRIFRGEYAQLHRT